ncbi:MAG: YhbY family RNA-binding protein [Oscillospiraceae bacterium]
MITSKQRAHLRGLANSMDTILQVGKNGIGDELITQVNDALKARELIKLRVLETSPVLAREAAQLIAEKTKCDIVQVIGTRFVLFKRNPQNPKVTLK